jgi:hypothetical protein
VSNWVKRDFIVQNRLTASNVHGFLAASADPASELHTDEAPTFKPPGRRFNR